MLYWKIIFAIFLTSLPNGKSGRVLNEYITHYETLNYDSSEIHRHHLRAKRSVEDPFIHIKFHAHGRHFHLRLKRDTSAFTKDVVVETPDGVMSHPDTLSHIVGGHIWGEPETHVYGSVREGVFEGKIHTAQGPTYYVEKAHKYFPSMSNGTKFHSVIYSSEDVVDAYADKRSAPILGGCGATADVMAWMNQVSNSALPNQEEEEEDEEFINQEEPLTREEKLRRFERRSVQERWFPLRRRQQQAHTEVSLEKRACNLFIQTDTFLWEHVRSYSKSDVGTQEELTSLISQHVKAVNHIYENTDFNGFRGIKFVVQRIKINDSRSCEGTANRWTNPFCSPNIDVSNFLNLNSQTNHNDFCLAYVFTYRDFSGGTLGLAWVASATGASGGICEKYKSYTENIQGRQVQTKRSLNTGVITFVNYNSRVPPKVSELTLAHEIGHNCGSPHDFPLKCRPGGSTGNYIMYASATSGDRQNNNKFSSCSVSNISAVLQVIFHGEGKENCFRKDDGAFCGNKIVEAGEECDCGYDDRECTEVCCYPKESKFEVDFASKSCKLRQGKQCSPSQGPCCSDNCHFVLNGQLCREESECNYESFCDSTGIRAECPPPRPKPNRTECNKGTQVCWAGQCIGSICQKYGLEECFFTGQHHADVPPEKMCEVACQEPNKPETCRSTYDIRDMQDIRGIKLQPGSPCNDFKGYCDVFQKCRLVDAEGPLARLKNLLFTKHTLMTVKQWVTTYWWAVMLMLVALAIVMAGFIKCCAVHTPSSNPRKAPALRITDTLRHPASTLRRKRHRVPPSSSPNPPPPSGPPPPYPGGPSAPPIDLAGPSRGYGEGRGHYNRGKERPRQHEMWGGASVPLRT
ncbi:ADAM10 [Cordylochernes scorpioides]|uniref:ADAM10 endopeptidase n=1 Tax=Cordylochernes scorpioides TaxID=51811 RepID=A0ABY6KSE8_9ARAC|nr:ADAM10 [Cordylochernes scorpioides]